MTRRRGGKATEQQMGGNAMARSARAARRAGRSQAAPPDSGGGAPAAGARPTQGAVEPAGGAPAAAQPEIVYGRQYSAAAVCTALRISRATLRRYRQAGIAAPAPGAAGGQWYDDEAVARLRLARRLIRDLGLNLAGASVALRLLEQLATARHAQLAAPHPFQATELEVAPAGRPRAR
jgi:DNA-binding transcriptional MerR regulator